MGTEVNKKEKVFKYKCSFSGTINDTMNKRGWRQVEENSDDWDIFWCDLKQLGDLFSTRILEDHQRVGHFRNCFEISRKNTMVRNLKRMRYKIEKAWGKEEAEKLDFFPTTFVLPTEHKQFMLEYRRNPGMFWIIKPAAGAQGRGIYIFERLKDYFEWRGKFDSPENELILRHQQAQLRELHFKEQQKILATNPQAALNPKAFMEALLETNELNPGDSQNLKDSDMDPDAGIPANGSPDASTITIGNNQIVIEPNKNDVYVVQRYISSPYLIGGRKFDIRLFVLVTSYQPLKAWMYRDGFARFSRGQFSLKSLRDIYVHLTNVAIQKTSEDYDAEKGSKWSLHNLREYMTARHGPDVVQKLMNNIDTIVIRTLQSVQGQIIHDKHCFELYGFDVIIDAKLKPWLLEVNASPAFTPSNEEDYRLKCALLDDTVHVLDLEGRLTGFEKRVGGYDLFWSDGVVYASQADTVGCGGGTKINTFLGCLNDRVVQLRNIFGSARYIREAHNLHVGGGSMVEVPLHTIAKTTKVKDKDARYRVPD